MMCCGAGELVDCSRNRRLYCSWTSCRRLHDSLFIEVQGHLSFEILSILIISLQYVVQDHLEDFNWCCHGICNPTAHSRGKQHCISQNLEVKKFLIDALIYEVLFLNLSSIF
ncbi:hypothetical protein S245_020215 [Arachis hypogaea]